MTDAPEQQQAPAATATSNPETKDTEKTAPASPARSDKSSDSEGKNVREKLKDTQIDAQATSNPGQSYDQAMNDVPNGSAKLADQSVSGSDSERGRLRRKRSREDFEDDAEADKQPEKKVERHMRKRSRDITKDMEAGISAKPSGATISSIKESDADEQMTSPNKNASTTTTAAAAAAADKASGSDTSPKNKRTRDQAEKDAEATTEGAEAATANGKPVKKALGEERDTKRLRDKDSPQSASDTESKSKIPPGSGFANFSAASPFAAMAAKPQESKTSDKPESLPQTSDDKFKASGFGGFAASASSPFGGLANPKPSANSPFGAASGSKLASFAGSAAPSTSTSGGFGALGGSASSTFGGSSFGASSGSGFGGFGAGKTVGSFAAPGGNLEIKGLKEKEKPFGAAAIGEPSDDEDEDDEDPEKAADKEERQSSQPLLSQQQAPETGEEGESTIWTGRAKLYNMAGEGSNRGWKERGVGTFKFNITADEPKKARFVLRAEGTHRLLLNAAVTRKMVFGGDAQGEKPKDGRLLFNSPNMEGELEMHLLRMKAENAKQLWEEVTKVQEEQL